MSYKLISLFVKMSEKILAFRLNEHFERFISGAFVLLAIGRATQNCGIVEVGRVLWTSSGSNPCSKQGSARLGCSGPRPVWF